MKKPEQQTLEDEPRKRGYVFPTWITKLLAGENQCWYSAWYKTHFKYKKVVEKDREAFFADYTARHDAIAPNRAMFLKLEGWTVKVEEQGEFRVNGKLGDISGKPDIVAMKDDEALVVEVKSGKPRQSDHWQVLLYLLFLPLDWMKGFKTIRGEVEYPDGVVVDVRPLQSEEREKIGAALRLVTGPDAPAATPSSVDCRFCDIARCEYRYKASAGDAGSLF